jgi:hypothetical protein
MSKQSLCRQLIKLRSNPSGFMPLLSTSILPPPFSVDFKDFIMTYNKKTLANILVKRKGFEKTTTKVFI